MKNNKLTCHDLKIGKTYKILFDQREYKQSRGTDYWVLHGIMYSLMVRIGASVYFIIKNIDAHRFRDVLYTIDYIYPSKEYWRKSNNDAYMDTVTQGDLEYYHCYFGDDYRFEEVEFDLSRELDQNPEVAVDYATGLF